MMPLRDITSLDNRPALPAGSQRPQERMKEYKLGQQLGKGAYGIVYEVTDRRDGKVHALKQMDFKITPEGVPQSVLREITIMQSASRKRHPNILRVIEVFQSPSRNDSSLQVNMILEKCDWDLYTFLRSIPKRCPDFQCRNIIKQIFKGVDFLHSNNIVHRDLKPQNILINRDQTLKLADFGLSRSYSSTSAFTTRVVTLWYRSPELLLQVEYGSGVDIWSVGCIISEIYSGEPLFPGNSESHQLKMILQKMGTPDESDWPTTSVVSIQSFEDFPGVPMTRLNPALPPAAIDLITNCLRFDPCTRLTALEALKSPLLRDDGLGTAV